MGYSGRLGAGKWWKILGEYRWREEWGGETEGNIIPNRCHHPSVSTNIGLRRSSLGICGLEHAGKSLFAQRGNIVLRPSQPEGLDFRSNKPLRDNRQNKALECSPLPVPDKPCQQGGFVSTYEKLRAQRLSEAVRT
jgi:hypothetical protein